MKEKSGFDEAAAMCSLGLSQYVHGDSAFNVIYRLSLQRSLGHSIKCLLSELHLQSNGIESGKVFTLSPQKCIERLNKKGNLSPELFAHNSF